MSLHKILQFHLPERYRPTLVLSSDPDQPSPDSKLKHRCFIIDFAEHLPKPIILGQHSLTEITK